MELDLTNPSSPSWKDVGQLTEKAGTKLEISTIDCDLVHSYIEEDTSTTTPSDIACPDDWSEFGGECYKYFDNSDNWEDAKEHCVSEEVLMILF